MQVLALTIAVLLAASGAFAQDAGGFPAKKGLDNTPPSDQATLGELLSKGYEIRAAVPNGTKFVVFMQKDQSAYACEMQSLSNSRCGTLN